MHEINKVVACACVACLLAASEKHVIENNSFFNHPPLVYTSHENANNITGTIYISDSSSAAESNILAASGVDEENESAFKYLKRTYY